MQQAFDAGKTSLGCERALLMRPRILESCCVPLPMGRHCRFSCKSASSTRYLRGHRVGDRVAGRSPLLISIGQGETYRSCGRKVVGPGYCTYSPYELGVGDSLDLPWSTLVHDQS